MISTLAFRQWSRVRAAAVMRHRDGGRDGRRRRPQRTRLPDNHEHPERRRRAGKDQGCEVRQRLIGRDTAGGSGSRAAIADCRQPGDDALVREASECPSLDITRPLPGVAIAGTAMARVWE